MALESCFNAMANQTIRHIGTLLCLAYMALPAWADVFVVTASSSPIESIGAKDLQSLYISSSVDLNDGNVRAIGLPGEPVARSVLYDIDGAIGRASQQPLVSPSVFWESTASLCAFE